MSATPQPKRPSRAKAKTDQWGFPLDAIPIAEAFASQALLRQVRAGFTAQGTSFSRWCRENDILRSSASQALTGSWDGPKARALRARIIKAAGLTVRAAA